MLVFEFQKNKVTKQKNVLMVFSLAFFFIFYFRKGHSWAIAKDGSDDDDDDPYQLKIFDCCIIIIFIFYFAIIIIIIIYR